MHVCVYIRKEKNVFRQLSRGTVNGSNKGNVPNAFFPFGSATSGITSQFSFNRVEPFNAGYSVYAYACEYIYINTNV